MDLNYLQIKVDQLGESKLLLMNYHVGGHRHDCNQVIQKMV